MIQVCPMSISPGKRYCPSTGMAKLVGYELGEPVETKQKQETEKD